MASSPVVIALGEMTAADVPGVIGAQQPGAVLGLAGVFPQDKYPFPRDVIARRWVEEIASSSIDCLVVLRAGAIVGFAATREDEFMHFGIAVEHWGSGVAKVAHDLVLDRMRVRGVQRARLRVFTANRRGRRFYEKCGWAESGDRSHSTFPPYPELLRYERDVGDASKGA